MLQHRGFSASPSAPRAQPASWGVAEGIAANGRRQGQHRNKASQTRVCLVLVWENGQSPGDASHRLQTLPDFSLSHVLGLP